MKKKKRPITPFGKDVKRRLIDLEQDQAWLIGEGPGPDRAILRQFLHV